ncbi:Transcriptional regulatory protein CusR [Fusobacterium necrogenes]|uniref:Transcriptional regulatory protein CusR n=1 Tax=Fusobacterium necrogenes TaxID=858 RepID=A0A377GVR5_9FUSO|nr:winged helix-turn-helix domain-containing protein [Fusobacterium necrogenes]STO31087.1 Transcriptional regulatory protein CusR [Fusobacterium necrogenes]
MNILVIQREKKQAEYIANGLKESGYMVNFTDNFDEGYHFLDSISYDLVIIDTIISGRSGLDFCKSVKEISEATGIVFLTYEADINLKIKAFDCGGDDYILKPFTFLELLARIRAIIRRIKLQTRKYTENKLVIRDLSLDYLTREVYRAERKIELTSKEFTLLEYFMRNRNIVLTRTILKEQIWGIDFISDTNIVDVYVKYLRDKIDKNFERKFFYTIRGAGYILK